MGIKLVHKTTSKEEILYVINELGQWEDVNIIKDILVKQFNAKVIRVLDGIWSRYVTLERNGESFELAYHEDYGVFFKSVNHPRIINEKLDKLINEVIPRIEANQNIK